MNYEQYIARCIEIARRGEYYVAPNPMVGAVLVDGDGRVLAEGWHERFGEGHAEVNCFRSLEKSNYRDIDLSKCTLFVSLEPCSHYGKTPPCAKLIIEKGVGRVVVGMLDPNPLVAGRGVKMLREAGIEVVVGVLEKECRELNKRFLMLHEHHRPYVVLKWAQTADHRMRAENMAIMVGTNTVIMDNPRLMTTHWEGRNPIRVTVDRHNRIPMESRIFERKESDYPGIDPVIVYRERTDWEYILEDLAGRGIHSIMVEGGTTLLNHIIETGLWDEMHVEVAPEITIGEGVAAPSVNFADFNGDFEVVDGHKLYTIYQK